jgi:hypothetical protein
MRDRRSFRPLTLVADAVTGLAIFLLLAGVLSHTCSGHTLHFGDVMAQAHAAKFEPTALAWGQSRADTLPLAMITKYPEQVFRGTDRSTAFVVLAAVFTLLFVANVALYRHLRAQYSRPRRRRRTLQVPEL